MAGYLSLGKDVLYFRIIRRVVRQGNRRFAGCACGPLHAPQILIKFGELQPFIAVSYPKILAP